MAKVYDVAAYILAKQGEMTAMKLQKLCYYSHAWHLVWEEQPLSDARIEAWANGPVVKELYNTHRGHFRIASMPGWTEADASRLTPEESTTVDAVLDYYGDMTAHQLSELTHSERPWQEARRGVPAGARSNTEITDTSMAAYYDSLTDNADQS